MRKSNILILIIIIAAIIIHLADIKISGTVVIAIILLVWAAIIDWNFSKLRKSLESKIDSLEEKIKKQEEKDEIEKFSKMSSFVCKVSIQLNDRYLLDKMKELGFEPKKDFEQSSYEDGFFFNM